MTIQNRATLLSHGNTRGRQDALDILEAGLRAADPYENVRDLVRIDGDRLIVGGHPEMDVSGFGDEVIDLRGVRNVYVVGAGKSVQRQALALEDILGDRLTAGAITAKKGEGKYLKRIEVTEGAHPVPDEDSVAGAQKIVDLVRDADARDLVFTVFSDGVSSLFALPAEGYTLDDVRAVYKLAIKFGHQGVIVNTMKHFSQVNYGRITRIIHPARSVNLVMCTVDYQRWHGKLPLSTSFVPSWPPGPRDLDADVRKLQRNSWYRELPDTMRLALDRRDPRREVPDLDCFRDMRLSFWQPVSSQQMVQAAARKAEALGYHGAILGLWSLANAGEFAHFMSGLARQISFYGQPFEPPVALISTGELTVPVGGSTGIGGRNQEFVIASALLLGGDPGHAVWTSLPISDGIVFASVDSDGTDGPGTQFSHDAPDDFRCQAGGIVDQHTLGRAAELGIDLEAEIRNHNASIPLWRLGDSIYTGNTGTCVGDLRVALIPERHR